jgi:hypothetical protein
MFLLFFPPPATGWLSTRDDAESIEGIVFHGRKWVHTAARTVAAMPTAPGKEIVGTYWGLGGGVKRSSRADDTASTGPSGFESRIPHSSRRHRLGFSFYPSRLVAAAGFFSTGRG